MKQLLLLSALPLFLLVSFVLGAPTDSLVTVPSASFRASDWLTGVPLEVSVDEFRLARTETTQREFQAVMGYNPSSHLGPDLPVESVSWWEAIGYCNRRSIQEGLDPCYDLTTGKCDFSRNGYRLPTEAEWDLADSSLTAWPAEQINSHANLGSDNMEDIQWLMKDLKEKATRAVGSYEPNVFGLYDMLGNVWEWCNDYNYNPTRFSALPVTNPQGPGWSPERVIRGGSFFTTTSFWNWGLRSCFEPDRKSRYTGFRVARTSPGRGARKEQIDEAQWLEPYYKVPPKYENNTGGLSSLIVDDKGKTIATLDQWQAQRKLLHDKWMKIIGTLPVVPPAPTVRIIRTFEEDIYTGYLMQLQVEPDYWEEIYLMVPNRPLSKPVPAVIVPYYDVGTPAGKHLGGRRFTAMSVRSFAYMAVQRGMIAVSIRWFGESYGENYAESIGNLRAKYPNLSGMGKWVWDSQRLVDYLCTRPDVDKNRIGIIGHSLGAMVSLYAAAFDERIAVVTASEPGLGLHASDFEHFFYLDASVRGWDKATEHHELLALIAPRPFLLIAGNEADKDESVFLINAAREVYSLYGKPRYIGFFNHAAGHTPTPEAVGLGMDWLRHFLGK